MATYSSILAWRVPWTEEPGRIQSMGCKDLDTTDRLILSLFSYICIYINTMEYYSAIKKKKILPFSTTWVDLEDIMLSELSQTEKDKYCMFSLICRN